MIYVFFFSVFLTIGSVVYGQCDAIRQGLENVILTKIEKRKAQLEKEQKVWSRFKIDHCSDSAFTNIDTLSLLREDTLLKMYYYMQQLCADPVLEKYLSELEGLQSLEGKVKDLKSKIESDMNLALASGKWRQYQRKFKKYSIAREKLKYWQRLYDKPDELEVELLAYLQGDKNWKNILASNRDPGTLSTADFDQGTSIDELERLGFQTKRQVKANMQKQHGDDMFDALQNDMGKQLSQYLTPLEKIKEGYNNIKTEGAQMYSQLSAHKAQFDETLGAMKTLKKPFSNPMRGVPFRFRFVPQYSFSTQRPDHHGNPALFQASAALLFRNTERLSLGAGLKLGLGLGQGWRDIAFSFQQLSVQAVLDYSLPYGFSFQTVYDKGIGGIRGSQADDIVGVRKFSDYFAMNSSALYAGVMKKYKMSNKIKGTFFIGYDFLWRQQELMTPIVIKFGFSK